VKDLIESIDAQLGDPNKGLPEDLFLFVSRMTPMTNVDLLIRRGDGAILLTWRDDGFYPPCWHIPGGIIRFKETAEERVKQVASKELRTEVSVQTPPLRVGEYIHPSRAVRGHFISLLYACELIKELDPSLALNEGDPQPGQWAWHKTCPEDLIAGQATYRDIW